MRLNVLCVVSIAFMCAFCVPGAVVHVNIMCCVRCTWCVLCVCVVCTACTLCVVCVVCVLSTVCDMCMCMCYV